MSKEVIFDERFGTLMKCQNEKCLWRDRDRECVNRKKCKWCEKPITPITKEEFHATRGSS